MYLLAPSAYRSAAAPGSLGARLGALPSHVFQRSTPGRPRFSGRQRLATLGLKAVQYGTVGAAMGALGAALVHALVGLRERSDPSFAPPAAVQSVGGVAALWGAFMASNSNVSPGAKGAQGAAAAAPPPRSRYSRRRSSLPCHPNLQPNDQLPAFSTSSPITHQLCHHPQIRYNLINLCEDLLFARSAAVGRAGTVALRLANNYAGAAQWVTWTRAVDISRPWRPRAAVAASKEM